MKKFFLIVWTMVLAVALTACNKGESGEMSVLSQNDTVGTSTTVQSTTTIPTTTTHKPTTAVGEYTVTFDLGYGGKKFTAKSKNYKVAKPTDPERSGYTFIGWFPEDEDLPWFFAGHMVTGEMTLIAKWEKTDVTKDVIIDIGDLLPTTTTATTTTITTITKAPQYDSNEGWSPIKTPSS